MKSLREVFRDLFRGLWYLARSPRPPRPPEDDERVYR